jgi:hypothetical protein
MKAVEEYIHSRTIEVPNCIAYSPPPQPQPHVQKVKGIPVFSSGIKSAKDDSFSHNNSEIYDKPQKTNSGNELPSHELEDKKQLSSESKDQSVKSAEPAPMNLLSFYGTFNP